MQRTRSRGPISAKTAGPVLPDIIGARIELATLPRLAAKRQRRGARGQGPGKASRQGQVIKNAVDLLTFFRYPKSQWKSLRTTNALERLNGEFRRRVKTQRSFPSESSVLVLLFGIVASGMVRLRKIVGYEETAQVVAGRQFDRRESHQMALAA